MSQPRSFGRYLWTLLAVLALALTGTWLWRVFQRRAEAHGRAFALARLPAGVRVEYRYEHTLGVPGARCTHNDDGVLRCTLFEDALQLPQSTPRGLRWTGTFTVVRTDVDACRRSRWAPALQPGSVDVALVPGAEVCTDGWRVVAEWYHPLPW